VVARGDVMLVVFVKANWYHVYLMNIHRHMCCTAVLLYCCTVVLLYCCTVVLLYCSSNGSNLMDYNI
jgi:maltodextrin utilization protein YvdJ